MISSLEALIPWLIWGEGLFVYYQDLPRYGSCNMWLCGGDGYTQNNPSPHIKMLINY
jgi:hypothetical protein